MIYWNKNNITAEDFSGDKPLQSHHLGLTMSEQNPQDPRFLSCEPMEISNILEARIELLHAQNGAVAYSVALLDQQNYITHIISNANNIRSIYLKPFNYESAFPPKKHPKKSHGITASAPGELDVAALIILPVNFKDPHTTGHHEPLAEEHWLETLVALVLPQRSE